MTNARPRRIEELELQDAGDHLLVHDPATKKIHVLNASAGAILRLCDGTHDVVTIVERLASNGAADRSVVAGDVHRILQEFSALGLLHERAVDRDSDGAH